MPGNTLCSHKSLLSDHFGHIFPSLEKLRLDLPDFYCNDCTVAHNSLHYYAPIPWSIWGLESFLRAQCLGHLAQGIQKQYSSINFDTQQPGKASTIPKIEIYYNTDRIQQYSGIPYPITSRLYRTWLWMFDHRTHLLKTKVSWAELALMWAWHFSLICIGLFSWFWWISALTPYDPNRIIRERLQGLFEHFY